ncbi:hypothetical protein FVEN_g5508 [Fusarium venenatum]|uniref:Uncharacterized protein n=1 Tax=Fusarium venenatum TaxID=56646 RepID=A0A2L2TJV3_9HYPO|nr:uncharacterized protein FVRRES_08400 [Fusarium venenatum]KAG8356881.1 hypothetical protein FVEN_g5508 [Fusarium venenatum]CEI68323.1 unnamed protein product [Fusarium venenatum]
MRETTGAEVHVKEERDLDPPTTTITTCVLSPVPSVDGDQESSLQPCDSEPQTADPDLADSDSQSGSDDAWHYDVLDVLKALDYTDPDYIPKFLIGGDKSSKARCHCSDVGEGQILCECDEPDKNLGSKKILMIAQEPDEYPRRVLCYCKKVGKEGLCECDGRIRRVNSDKIRMIPIKE